MTREHYLRKYAKDAKGNYVGTESPAVDVGLVFVPGKSTDGEFMQQVRKVGFGTEHSNQYHMVSLSVILWERGEPIMFSLYHYPLRSGISY
jgi:hypothetical protein